MKKDEFLSLLRQALSGDVPPGVIEENIRYYDGYIADEVRRGTPEEEVIAVIGDPRLIARTIEATTDVTASGTFQETGEAGSQTQSNPYEQNPYQTGRQFHMVNINKWYWKLLGIIIIFAVIFIVLSVIGGIFAILSPLLGPLLIIMVVLWLFRSFKGRR